MSTYSTKNKKISKENIKEIPQYTEDKESSEDDNNTLEIGERKRQPKQKEVYEQEEEIKQTKPKRERTPKQKESIYKALEIKKQKAQEKKMEEERMKQEYEKLYKKKLEAELIPKYEKN